MEIKTINAALCAKMFLGGAKNLEAKKEWINELNVFPVPDGDTGTNMTLTIMSAAQRSGGTGESGYGDPCARQFPPDPCEERRGNSGVILSQLLRGFTKGIKEHEEIWMQCFWQMPMEKAVETAYKAVMKPKEGTILTVARGMR